MQAEGRLVLKAVLCFVAVALFKSGGLQPPEFPASPGIMIWIPVEREYLGVQDSTVVVS